MFVHQQTTTGHMPRIVGRQTKIDKTGPCLTESIVHWRQLTHMQFKSCMINAEVCAITNNNSSLILTDSL